MAGERDAKPDAKFGIAFGGTRWRRGIDVAVHSACEAYYISPCARDIIIQHSFFSLLKNKKNFGNDSVYTYTNS